MRIRVPGPSVVLGRAVAAADALETALGLVPRAAEVRGSTAGAGAARTVSAQVGTVVAVPDQRTDASVDLVLGAAFVRLQPVPAAAAALRPSPQPVPSGC